MAMVRFEVKFAIGIVVKVVATVLACVVVMVLVLTVEKAVAVVWVTALPIAGVWLSGMVVGWIPERGIQGIVRLTSSFGYFFLLLPRFP